jgi:5'-methylthioadenosine phosphorylase
VGRVGKVEVAFLPRHGAGHRIPPHRVNYRANLWALRKLGARRILATSSTGSLKRGIRPGTLVVPDDYVGFWMIPTYHDDRVVHATPDMDEGLRSLLVKAAKSAGASARDGGVYVQTAGPRLETRAEIAFFRTLGDVLGMTMASEATLAAELGLAYASLCSVDNYCNGIVDAPLTFDDIRRMQARTSGTRREVMRRALEALA